MAEVNSPAQGAIQSQGVVTLESSYTRGQIDGALALSEYVLSTGFQSASGETVPLDAVEVIQGTAVKLGILASGDGTASQPGRSISAADWNDLERAYYRLAVFASPVTAETLDATRAITSISDESETWWNRLIGNSPALRFTRRFSFVTIVIAVAILTGECLVYYWGLDPDTTRYAWERNLAQILLPWGYGALGSCAYLLRSAHYFIYQRCFDLRRKPEYFNRVLLGAISGGAIILFVDYLVDSDSGDTLHLSSAALGFVAGYSTDFLFNTIERIVAAIFPRDNSDLNPKQQVGRKAALPKNQDRDGSPDEGNKKPEEEN
ncbi:hypothetical protein XH99_32470 [Bradyrhizobium nanningense]|uniref:Uncharacterized protein n=1 Tax=Bradyrhizobium nanningense TaxID=1325118 RepID=A0A4Q0RWB9_9BRAD|nr:hypothetical protein [Bradyrhizobium nanningense]RXH23419.1 hypothetical protein XH99_32470 [Bradyrhizobium nanningense]RXH27479.1 hypothetical protein XH84_29160 [Bradyrhizobium nanningense]